MNLNNFILKIYKNNIKVNKNYTLLDIPGHTILMLISNENICFCIIFIKMLRKKNY